MSTVGDLIESQRREKEARLTAFRHHDGQQRFFRSEARFVACCAPRRGGKSDLARRRQARRALRFHETNPQVLDPLFVITCPTRDQVKRLHWDALKRVYPPSAVMHVSESELQLTLLNGVRHRLVGLDKFVRAEGEAIDDALVDEFADTKEDAWRLSLRPALSTPGRPGRATFIGKPRGRNHWWRLWTEAAEKDDWEQHRWGPDGILDAEEIAALQRDLDPLSFQQEVMAEFVNFAGRAYYAFERSVHASHELEHDPKRPLLLEMDFNREPGVCLATQVQTWLSKTSWPTAHSLGFPVSPWIQGEYDAVLWECHVPKNSNTLKVTRRFIEAWKDRHSGYVDLYGDAAGGNRTSSSVAGSDWDLVKRELRQVPHWRIRDRVPAANPPVRDRVNAVNSRLMTTDGRVRMMVDPSWCPKLIEDLESVGVKPDGSGDVDKRDKEVTHLSDARGYSVWRRDPVRSRTATVEQV